MILSVPSVLSPINPVSSRRQQRSSGKRMRRVVNVRMNSVFSAKEEEEARKAEEERKKNSPFRKLGRSIKDFWGKITEPEE